ncbi:MAG: hypothetical protein M1833_002072 [Piccolia ochrophora]|nr:MAG: hypothetical protein M1833_002072 [Piccolia ochrophora]
MSYSYERIERRGTSRQHRTTFGYWVPLVVTVTVAAAGVVAWIWSERRDDDEDGYDYGGRDSDREGRPGRPPPHYGDLGPGETSFATGAEGPHGDVSSEGVVARMSGALRRTPSPQQLLDGASKKAAAGVAAVGAVVGGALSSIREEDKDDYGDHSRWSTEQTAQDSRQSMQVRRDASGNVVGDRQATMSGALGVSGSSTGRSVQQPGATKRKTVAIVVSAESSIGNFDEDSGYHHDDPAFVQSILSHLPGHINPATTRTFVLIYSPDLKQHPLSSASAARPGESITSSYSNIGHEDVRTPGEETDKPLSTLDPRPLLSPSSGADTPRTPTLPVSSSPAFTTLYTQAQAIVEKDHMIMPFTTPAGHVHMLRHLAPEAVYIQESLCGDNGDVVTHVSGWVGQVVVVVGAEGGHGGLVDSEDEVAQASEKGEQWWQKAERVGLGKGVEVVEGMRIGEDWGRRIGGAE